MRINAVSQLQNQPFNKHNVNLKNNNVISFRAGLLAPGEKTAMVVNNLLGKGIILDASQRLLPSRDFVAGCIENTVTVFEKLFGLSSLPSKITLKPLKGPVGTYMNSNNEVAFDSNMSCFESMASLKKDSLSGINPLGMTLGGALLGIAPNFASTIHPAHVFVHEFSHSAHYNHLVERNGQEEADKVWSGLYGSGVPTSIGRLITRFHLGNYAVAANDMCEFLAERMTQDICDNMDRNFWTNIKSTDVGYTDIYNRKWNYRYSSPQSYIDYFTQQVWNGDLEGAKQVGCDAETYLDSLDTNKVPDSVVGVFEGAKKGVNAIVESVSGGEVSAVVSKGVEQISQGIDVAAEKVKGFFGRFTDSLDAKNKIKIKRW